LLADASAFFLMMAWGREVDQLPPNVALQGAFFTLTALDIAFRTVDVMRCGRVQPVDDSASHPPVLRRIEQLKELYRQQVLDQGAPVAANEIDRAIEAAPDLGRGGLRRSARHDSLIATRRRSTTWHVSMLAGVVLLCGCSTLHYDRTQPGELKGKLTVEWVRPDEFVFRPDKHRPLTFIRRNKDVITPGLMYTDGGCIRRPLWAIRSYSPWGYAPAYIHDWLFHVKNCQLPGHEKLTLEESAWVLS
jgi:hypothetical protein